MRYDSSIESELDEISRMQQRVQPIRHKFDLTREQARAIVLAAIAGKSCEAISHAMKIDAHLVSAALRFAGHYRSHSRRYWYAQHDDVISLNLNRAELKNAGGVPAEGGNFWRGAPAQASQIDEEGIR